MIVRHRSILLLFWITSVISFVKSDQETLDTFAFPQQNEQHQNDQNAEFVPNLHDFIHKEKSQQQRYGYSMGGLKTSKTSSYGGGSSGIKEISMDQFFQENALGGHGLDLNMNLGIKKTGSQFPVGYGGYGMQKTKSVSGNNCMTPPALRNTNVQCSGASNTCKATCRQNYKFPNGQTTLYLSCEGGEWTAKDSEWDELPFCEPICHPPCQNNGICIMPGQCTCPDNFVGPQCQHEKKMCLQKPVLPSNSRLTCSQSQCTITCAKGYRFPDGSTVTNMVCKNGEWSPTKEDWQSIPDCQPVCSPNCQNGGNCLSFNVCQCPPEYRGPQCQYNVANCSPKKLNFNGGYNCSGTGDSISCSIYCPPGVSFDVRPPTTKYSCNYKDAKFVPEKVPQCVYGAGVSVSKSFQSGYSMSSSSGQWEFEGQFQKSGKNRMFNTPGVYSMYMTSEVDMSFRQPKRGICMTWNGNKIKTFDGLVYTSSLYCSHTLIHDKVDGVFSVILRNCAYGDSSDCSSSLVVLLSNIKYLFENVDGVVKFSTIKSTLPIPSQLPGLRVVMVGKDLKIEMEQVQTTITWDLNRFITIEANPSLWNRTSGLCGTFDSDITNDFMSKDGKTHSAPRTFVDSWRAPSMDLDSSKCIMDSDEDFDVQNCESQKLEKAKSTCKQLLKNKKFANCNSKFNAEMLMNSCITDYCFCQDKKQPRECACNSMNVLAKDCTSSFGINFDSGWRDFEICPMTCENGRVYKPCGPISEQSCGQAIILSDKNQKCHEGCFCPEGKVQFDGQCIDKSDCPCRLRGKNFKSGAQIVKDCNTCTCDNGNWVCTDVTCGSRCGAIGDPHYNTFDGRRFDFMGKCQYYLLKTDNITIESDNVPCSGAISEELGLAPSFDQPSCTRSVKINYMFDDKPVKIDLKQGRKVFVNDAPFENLPRELSKGLVKIRHASSTFLVVDFQDGFKVWWDGMTRVYLDAPPKYRGKTSGLCGTFNSNSQDDFLTPEGDIESVAESFADKWKTNEKCPLPKTEFVPNPCQLNIENKNMADKYCSLLKGPKFEACHWQVDHIPYYEDCMYDVCSCKGDVANCMCPILSSYAAECARQGVILDWRHQVNQCAIKCAPGQVYEECGDSCSLTCRDIQLGGKCKTQCIEGCRCPNGQSLDDNNECVPVSMCPCSYKGMVFNSGHKEVRPGNKFLELCTCDSGKWNCVEALDGDATKYPAASNMQSKCMATKNEEFTTCEPAEPITCKNMHYYLPSSPAECVPGCTCKKGYVLDISLKKCVLPKDCSCHHGGQSYNDGEKIQEDCNTCICKSGKWDCTQLKCPSLCSAWGDSHFTTFDGKDFDFQGVCNYVLSKGTLNPQNGYSVVIQNVLCGSMGETCSKSVQLTVQKGNITERLDLNEDILLPGSKLYYNSKSKLSDKLQTINLYRSGLFLIAQVPHLNLQLEWDRGTRIYVKLGNEWRGHVQGLCGNYNGDIQDDLKTPSNGLETSAKLFGDSWKLQEYCPETKEQMDSCAKHPERSLWSQKKCGVLKSPLFQRCHSEVSVDDFYKRCTHDACACDQGGDCECLCTALAAYATACTRKGVPIKWRSQELCPMQCDPICSNYDPCISKCPIETCDNAYDLCVADSCVEGCKLKGCPDGMVYKNETYSECVPRALCKPVCKVVKGITYYEGDIVSSDACQTCRCTKNDVKCIGVPCPDKDYELKTTQFVIATTVKPHITTARPYQEQDAKCETGWSDWINQDRELSSSGLKTGTKTKSKGLKIGDKEPLPSYLILRNTIGGSCGIENITKIECRTVNTHIEPKQTGQNVECSLDRGLVCEGPCYDYEIKVFCDCSPFKPKVPKPIKPEKISTICDPTIPHVEYPGDCYKFKHCMPAEDGSWKFAIKTCGPTMMFNPKSMTCDFINNVIAMKPECGVIGQVPQTIPEQVYQDKCPPGQTWSDCAVPCRKACHYYGKLLLNKGACKPSSSDCEPGCVDFDDAQVCRHGFLWRDKSTCVTITDCTCMSYNGLLVKPGDIFKESDCEICQCLDNSYVCDKTACDKTEYDVGQKGEQIPIIFTKAPEITKTFTKSPKIVTHESYVTIVKTVEPTKSTVILLPSTDAPPPKCEKHLLVPVINGEYPLSDSAFDASSYLSSAFKPQYSRLNGKPTQVSSGVWSPAENNEDQYMEITFPKTTPLFGVIIQGSPIGDQYVTMFKVTYSLDGTVFSYVKNHDNQPELFYGPIDARMPIETLFPIPIEAKVVRIHPCLWNEGIAIRLELLGCGKEKKIPEPIIVTLPPPIWIQTTTTMKYIPIITTTHRPFTTPKIVVVDEQPMCDDPMGVDNGKMSPPQVKVSSQKAKNVKPLDTLKLNSKRGWIPNLNSPNEFVIFDFLDKRNLTGIVTKGGETGFVTAYNVFYSNDKSIWNPIIDADKTVKIFRGNVDENTPKTNNFRSPIQARYLKITPTKWNEQIEMKIEPLGCFKPYPIIEEVVQKTDPPLESIVGDCGICPGVKDLSFDKKVSNVCKCYPPLFWNGQECSPRSQCPCMVGYTPYEVGAHYDNDDCEQCVCVLGGVPQCKPKECPPCATGLRPTKSKSCHCLCEPCPIGTVICETSGACISESAWCDGIEDCPDDEVNCKKAKPTIETVLNITKTCPTPYCKPGFSVKVINDKPPPPSAMFEQQVNFKTPIKSRYLKKKKNLAVQARFGDDDAFQSSLPAPIVITKTRKTKFLSDEEKCIEFICIPDKPIVIKNDTSFTKQCPKPECPPGYTFVIEKPATTFQCAKYDCEPEKQNDAVCQVTGRTFNTFDNVEFKYDICSHVLARDFTTGNWTIILSKNCAAEKMSCKKELEILDKESDILMKFYPDLTIDFNGYKYTVDQLQKSPMATSFVVSKVGETIVFVSHLHGFWVKYNNFGDIEIGVSPQKHFAAVDGLCGYYNGISEDDKRLPKGDLAKSTMEFGDSWKMPDRSLEECEPQVCPKYLQDEAFKMCNLIRHETFSPCQKSVDPDKFVSRCIETACECLKESIDNSTKTKTSSDLATKPCKCKILQSLVKECMAADDTVHLDMWRSIHGCEIECPVPLIHKDCYRRRCELSCDQMDLNSCSYLPGQCFSGCYCPEGMVRKGPTCVVAAQECRDCVCDNVGRSDFLTYDKKNFTFDGNCTYLMSRDIQSRDGHSFQIYATFDKCSLNSKQKDLSCAKILYIVGGKNVIKLVLENNEVRVILGDKQVKSFPLIEKWVKVEKDISGLHSVVLLDSYVKISNIKAQNGDLLFSIKVPSLKYGNKMEGLCGNCNDKPEDDLVLNPKSKKTNEFPTIKEIAESWLANEKLLNLDESMCFSQEQEKVECKPPSPEKDLCMKLLDENMFGKCHFVVDPIQFVSQCHKETCLTKDNLKSACEFLDAYAKQCAKNSICLDWRKDGLCPYNCPTGLKYEACGCPETCESIKHKQDNVKSTKKTIMVDVCGKLPVEGCFCPKDTVLRNGKCIPLKQCFPCDDQGHFIGDQWHPDKCTTCECASDGKIICTKESCSETVCAKGMKAVETPSNGCCKKYICILDQKKEVQKECPKPNIPVCGPLQVKKMEYDNNNCPKYMCECKPLSDCPKIGDIKNLKPGQKVTLDKSGCCPVEKVVCDVSLCPKKLDKCVEQFYEVQTLPKQPEDCCEQYKCIPPRDRCIVEIDGKKYLKSFGEKWPTDNPCIKKMCSIDSNGKPIVKDDIETCLVDTCQKGYKLEIPEGSCCGKCVQTECILLQKTYKLGAVWKEKDNNCTEYKCSKKNDQFYIESESETCPDIFDCPDHLRYFKGCCQFCKPEAFAEDLKNCMPVELSQEDTVNLVRKIVPVHGICSNIAPIPKFMECHGKCNSGTKYNKESMQFEKQCDCCSIQELQNMDVDLKCLDGYKMKILLAVPKVCNCSPCIERQQQQQQISTKIKSTKY